MPVSPTARRARFTLPVLALVVAAGTAPALAQAPAPPDSAKMKTEIAKLGWMIGTWEGDAWIQRGPEKIELRQKETVALRLDGLALLVDGEGRPKSDPSTVQYRALGVLYWDAYANALKLNSWTGEGYSAISNATILPDGVRWELATPNGKLRYTAKNVGGTWNEIGEWSADGTTWSKFMEMNLKKGG
jgi:hypothetical protein